MLDSTQIRKCMTILFQEPVRVSNRPLTTLEQEAMAILEAVDEDQTTQIESILTAWDAAWLDESSITANVANKGFSTSGAKARRLCRRQLVATLSYDPLPDRPMIGRG